MIAQDTVNEDEVVKIDEKHLDEIKGEVVSEKSFKWNQVNLTLGSKNAVVVNKEPVLIFPQLLFQRLTVVAGEENMETKYLCSYPAALFDTPYYPRLAK